MTVHLIALGLWGFGAVRQQHILAARVAEQGCLPQKREAAAGALKYCLRVHSWCLSPTQLHFLKFLLATSDTKLGSRTLT